MARLQEEKITILNLKQEWLKKAELKVEVQSLENLIILIKQKLEIEILEKKKEQLATKIAVNNSQIEANLNDNESFKNQLSTKIDEIN